MIGGGMRQAGVIAAAGLYALKNNIQRLQQDHDNAIKLAEAISGLGGLRVAEDPQTNMVILDENCIDFGQLERYLAEREIRISGNRWVLHQDISSDDVDTVIEACNQFDKNG